MSDCRKKPIQRTARGFQMQFRTPLLFASGGSFRQAVPALPDVVFSGGPAGTPFPIALLPFSLPSQVSAA